MSNRTCEEALELFFLPDQLDPAQFLEDAALLIEAVGLGMATEECTFSTEEQIRTTLLVSRFCKIAGWWRKHHRTE